MLDYRLDEEHETLRKTVAEFAHEAVAPVIGDYCERAEFPYPIIRQMADMGLFGLPFPEEYGGMGGDNFALCLAIAVSWSAAALASPYSPRATKISFAALNSSIRWPSPVLSASARRTIAAAAWRLP